MKQEPVDRSERELREAITLQGRSLFERRFTHGSTGNLSVRVPDGILITPTGGSLGRLDPDRISKIGFDGTHLSGDQPSKEAFLHLAMYRAREKSVLRENDSAIVHLHSTYSVAVSCLANMDAENVLPPITAYYRMRVGTCKLVRYFPPGDLDLAVEVERRAASTCSLLLANHGPVISARSIEAAVEAAEELEETAKLFLLLRNESTRYLNNDQCVELQKRFPDSPP